MLGQVGYEAGIGSGLRMPLETGYPAAQVIRTGQAVFLGSPEQYRERFPETWPLAAGLGRQAWAFLPLVSAGRTTGAWMASFRAERAFAADERALLAAVAKAVAQALERTRTGQAELALSLGLRRSMGAAAPERPGLTVASRYVPTGGGLMVGGDWYDVIDLPGGRIGLVIGDVEGHDVVAASLMSQLRTAIHAYAAEGHGPDAVLARTSRFLTALDDDRYATCIYIEADPATGTLALSRAGHPHPVLRLPDGTCLIKHVQGGLPLGLMDGEEDYPVTVVELEPDEVMLLCTDGLIETGGHDMYSGWIRVRDALSPDGPADLEGMADRLLQAVQGPTARTDHGALPKRNEDDIAFLLMRRDGGRSRPRQSERRLVLTIEQDQAEGLADARAQLRFLLHDWAVADQVDSAVLLCSELLANVLVHTDQTATLLARLEGEPGSRRLRVEVSDRGDELPHQRAPGELASSGRGLMLLELLADRWGVRPRPEGKTVWFDLDEASAS
ncbi:SpoIIE family protein phosphatase [Streptacidiphilus monticola]